ncbi:hypothetical protein PAJ34TS1_31720 [Paenibacillus azoreducens]
MKINHPLQQITTEREPLIKLGLFSNRFIMLWVSSAVVFLIFRSANAPLARNQLDHCEIKLAQFTDQVYQSEGKIEGEILHGDLN